MKKKDVYNKAKATWGIDARVTKAIEELSELQKELCKFLLDDGSMAHIIEEIADVKIMVEQLELIFECKAAVKTVKESKFLRLSAKLDAEEKLIAKMCENCVFEIQAENGENCSKCKNRSEWKLDKDYNAE